MTVTLRLPCAMPELADAFKSYLDQYYAGTATGVDGRYVLVPWAGESVDFLWNLAEVAEQHGFAAEFEVAEFAADAEKAVAA